MAATLNERAVTFAEKGLDLVPGSPERLWLVTSCDTILAIVADLEALADEQEAPTWPSS
jgi:hypothetical protein